MINFNKIIVNVIFIAILVVVVPAGAVDSNVGGFCSSSSQKEERLEKESILNPGKYTEDDIDKFAWRGPNRPVIFFQGILSSQTQAAKSVGPEGFTATTGERVSSKRGIPGFRNVYIGKEIPEVKVLLLPLIWYTKPLAWLVSYCNKQWYGITVEHNSTTSNKTIAGYGIDPRRINIGQEGDIETHREKYELCCKQYPQDTKELYGVSRGALTTFSAYGKHKYKDIGLVVLEGAPDRIKDVVKTQDSWWTNIKYMVACLVTQHKPDGKSTLDFVGEFPKDTPVAFITSEGDKEVPCEHTEKLARELVKYGHKRVYLLKLEDASHEKYTMHNQKDSITYRNFLHALHKRYKGDYIPAYAEQGRHILEECLLTKENSDEWQASN